jgi:hypothetical protein
MIVKVLTFNDGQQVIAPVDDIEIDIEISGLEQVQELTTHMTQGEVNEAFANPDRYVPGSVKIEGNDENIKPGNDG